MSKFFQFLNIISTQQNPFVLLVKTLLPSSLLLEPLNDVGIIPSVAVKDVPQLVLLLVHSLFFCLLHMQDLLSHGSHLSFGVMLRLEVVW